MHASKPQDDKGREDMAEVDDDETLNETAPEEMSPRALQVRALNLERSRERRTAQPTKKLEAVTRAKGEVAEKEAQILVLQAQADEVSAKITRLTVRPLESRQGFANLPRSSSVAQGVWWHSEIPGLEWVGADSDDVQAVRAIRRDRKADDPGVG